MSKFQEVSNTYSRGYYEQGYDDDPYSSGTIAGTGQIETIVTGDLADQVLSRSGKQGMVSIIEDHWDIGYCVTCSDEMVDFEVQVDGERVFRTRYASSGGGHSGGRGHYWIYSVQLLVER